MIDDHALSALCRRQIADQRDKLHTRLVQIELAFSKEIKRIIEYSRILLSYPSMKEEPE